MTRFLKTEPRIADPDGFYDLLTELNRDLDDEASRVVNAKLILLLANHIGDRAVLDEAIELAGGGHQNDKGELEA